MARTARLMIAQAHTAAQRIERHLPMGDPRRAATALISWAAFHLGGGSVAVAIAEGVRTADGFRDLSLMLDVDSIDSLESVAFTLCTTSTATALDLCSAAAFRLGGGRPKANREFDLGNWTEPSRAKYLASLPVPPALRRWVVSVLRAPEWENLKEARHQMVHRTTTRVLQVSLGSGRNPSPTYNVGGKAYQLDAATRRFASFGRRRFDSFCRAVAREYP